MRFLNTFTVFLIIFFNIRKRDKSVHLLCDNKQESNISDQSLRGFDSIQSFWVML